MQKKDKEFQQLGICHGLFNFIMNNVIGRGLKRLILGHPMPQESTNQGPRHGYPRHEPNGEERVNSKLKDDSDSTIKIHFKQTEELDDWPPAAQDIKAMEKRNESSGPSGKKEIPVLNGISVDTAKTQVKGKTEVHIQGEGSTAPPKIIIPITNKAGQNEKKKKASNEFPTAKTPIQPDVSKPMLTVLGLNINEISEKFIQNTRERMNRNLSLMETEES